MAKEWKEYQEKNKDRFLNEMLELLRIPSVSAKSEHKNDMRQCAELVKKRLLDAGADKAVESGCKGCFIMMLFTFDKFFFGSFSFEKFTNITPSKITDRAMICCIVITSPTISHPRNTATIGFT